ncbi:aspartate aminotransferase family protein [Oceanobacter mangrovi]|uniref:aspartate aminotransferase family protein n=1 Tax=Oceanobacter mangrovi TaxID=2862510 RepID=UPI001C8DB15A|nr:aspartate aminotransferase family protein [Oceanobacter mangrovi]
MQSPTEADNQVRGILEMNAFDSKSASGQDDPALQRRLANVGAASVLFYRQPIEMVSALGAWMSAANGKRYLDCYNNVPCVGHSHPAVTAAVSKQISRLNTNTRYLVQVVDDYLEALKAKFPAELSNAVLTCSGSEANDLAMRIACKNTGHRGFIVTEAAYHGNTAYVTEVSPSSFKQGSIPDHVVTVPAPSRANYGDDIAEGFAMAVKKAISTLKIRGYGIAALLVDSIFSSDGVFGQPQGFLRAAVDIVHQAGGFYIADEVQPGFGRLGSAFWGFEYHQVLPDIVTMGKPMGNGFPMAGMVTRPEYLARFCEDVGYFNTFGGNPVSCAAGLAVLKVMEQEELQTNAHKIGQYLCSGLNSIAADHAAIGEVRGEGLFLGVDICQPDQPELADPAATVRLIDGLRDAGILAGAAGKHGSTLKLRPALCLSQAEADFFLDGFRAAARRL